MKTKYVLHGGNAQDINGQNDIFFEEILRNTSSVVNVLLVHFAGSDDRLEINKERDTNQFNRAKKDKKIFFEIANEQNFIEQINKSDVIYLSGGTTVKLMVSLSKFKDLQKYLNGKIVAGESAGANCLSAFGYSKFADTVYAGLGLVPVKTIPHYLPGLETKFENAPKEVELLLLPNYHFKVFEI